MKRRPCQGPDDPDVKAQRQDHEQGVRRCNGEQRQRCNDKIEKRRVAPEHCPACETWQLSLSRQEGVHHIGGPQVAFCNHGADQMENVEIQQVVFVKGDGERKFQRDISNQDRNDCGHQCQRRRFQMYH